MFDEEKNIIYHKIKVKEFILNVTSPYNGGYQLCFTTTDGTTKKLSFDFEV